VIADIQQLAEVLAVPIQILFGVTCWRCEDQGFLGQSKANRIERILETILRPFDLSNPVGRKQAYVACVDYADRTSGKASTTTPLCGRLRIDLGRTRSSSEERAPGRPDDTR